MSPRALPLLVAAALPLAACGAAEHRGDGAASPAAGRHRGLEALGRQHRAPSDMSPGWLGMRGRTLSVRRAHHLRIDGQGGVEVVGVTADSPAARLGLIRATAAAAGDLVVGVDGALVTTPRELAARLRRHHPGEQAELALVRHGGQSLTVAITLVHAPLRPRGF